MKKEFDPKQECCPEFDPIPWDDKTFEWDNKKFIKGKVRTLFYIPINFGSVIKKLDQKISESGAKAIDWLCLSDHTSRWNMDIYLAVDKSVKKVENHTMSGKFFSKVYEGSFNETESWCKNFKEITTSKGFTILKMYMWYTTCPKCSKKYGKNYVTIIALVK